MAWSAYRSGSREACPLKLPDLPVDGEVQRALRLDGGVVFRPLCGRDARLVVTRDYPTNVVDSAGQRVNGSSVKREEGRVMAVVKGTRAARARRKGARSRADAKREPRERIEPHLTLDGLRIIGNLNRLS